MYFREDRESGGIQSKSFFYPQEDKLKKSMSQIDFEVTDDGVVFLSQESMCNENGYDSVMFPIEQASIIIKWIQDAIDERNDN